MKVIQLFRRVMGNGRASSLFSLFTPHRAERLGVGPRLLLAGGTVTLLGLSLAMAASSAALLLLATGIIYYLLTEVLGIKIDIDPRTIIQQAQRYAAPSAPN